MINSGSKSNRLLASRRYTHDSFTDAQESFTNVLDLQASEIYTQASKIPSSELPHSSSVDHLSYYTDSGDNILRYYFRHKLTKSNLNNEVWFFLNPTGSNSGIGAQLIDDNQQTSFISPKYSVSSLANATTEDSTPGYLAKVFMSSAATSASVSDSDVVSVNNYQFDYKTGVLQFINSSVDPSDSQYVYMSVYQYVGKTLAEGVEITGDISGSASSTGSFGHLVVQGNITASGTVRADAFESVTGGSAIDFKDSLNITGNLTASGDLSIDDLTASGNISGSLTSTGSFGVIQIPKTKYLEFMNGTTAQWRIFNSAANVFEISSTAYGGSPITIDATGGGVNVAANLDVGAGIDVVGNSTFTGNIIGSGVNAKISGSATSTGSFGHGFIANKLGIGETNPDTPLHVTGDGGITIEESGGTTRKLILEPPDGSTSAIIKADGSANGLLLKSDGGGNQIFLKNDGNVGIGNTNPGEKLVVSGTGRFTGALTLESTISNIATTHVTASGNISGSSISTGSFGNLRVAGLSQPDIKIISSSISTRLTTEEANVDALQTDSGSFSTRVTAITQSISELKTDSGSFSTRVTNLKADSGSFSTRVTNLVADSASFSTRITQDSSSTSFKTTAITQSISALKTDSGSFSTRITSDSSSFSTRVTNLKTDSGSFSTRVTNLKTDSGSFSTRITADSSSFSTRTTDLESKVGQSLNTSDSPVFDGLRVTGDIHAERYIVSSSVSVITSSFSSGSTIFGDTSDDTHRFTGSIEHSGSFNLNEGNLLVNDNTVMTGSLDVGGVTSFRNTVGIKENSPKLQFHSLLGAQKTYQIYGTSDNLVIRDGSQGTDRIEITSAGNIFLGHDEANDFIGMGTRTPSEKLEVIGNISASGDFLGPTTSTGSFGYVTVAGLSNPNLIEFSSSISSMRTSDSSSFSTRVTNLKSDSGSFSTRVTNLKSDSGSFSTRITNLVSDSASLSTRVTAITQSISALKSDSGSFSTRVTAITQSISALKSDSGSFSTRVTNLKTDSGSFSTRVTAITQSISALKTDSGSFSIRVTNLKTDSGSFSTRVTNLKSDSGSFSTRITADSSSFSTRVTNLKADSGSFSTRTTNLESKVGQSLNTTDSPQFAAISIDGDIVAQRIIVSSSVSIITQSFSSGSTIFGDTIDDTHRFTGSIEHSGSFNLNEGNLLVNSGNVGIGHTNPQTPLEVSMASGQLVHFGGSSITSDTNYAGISLGYANDGNSLKRKTAIAQSQFGDSNKRGHLHFLVDTTNDGFAVDLSDSKMMIHGTTGFVGINKTDPESALDVTGTIIASGNISGSLTSTGSFGHVTVAGLSNPNLIEFSSSISSMRTSDSSSFSTRVTNLKTDSGSFSTRTTFLEGSGEVQSLGTTNNVQFNSISASGDISGSVTSTGSFGRVEVAGDSSFTGNVTIGGNIQIGDADSDSLTISADLTSNLIPNADSTFDLGSPTKYWRNQYVDTITATGNISSSLVSTGSIAHLHVANNIGVGTQSPLATVHISASDGLIIPVGNTSQRSSNAIKGEIRFNDQIQSYEGYDGANWGSLGGMTDVDQDTKITAEDSAGDDNDQLKFFTAGIERLRINSDGHISASVNITSSGNLEILGNISSSVTSTGSFGYVKVTGLSNPNLIEFSSSISSMRTSDSSSFATRIDNLVTNSSSFSTRVTAITQSISALKTDSGSFSTRITTDSSSFSTRVTNLKTDSGSFSTRITADSSSFSTRTTTLEGTGTIQGLGTTNNVLFSSITASDDVRFQSDLVVDGTVTAQEFHTEIVSSSIIFTSGSTKFGDSIDDLHRFTGSLFISGNLTAVNLVADSGSVSTRLTAITQSISALKTDSGSFSTRVTNLKTDSGSFSTRNTLLEISASNIVSDSGSFSTRVTNLKTDSGSFSTRVTNLKSDSGSFSTRVTAITQSISALKTDSGSFSLRETNLETTSSALINNFDQVQSLGKTDAVVFSNITASNDISASGNLFISNNIDIDGTSNLAGNVLMQSELNVLGNITASGNISSSITSVASFGLIKEQGLNLNERMSRNVHEAFELDENGDLQPTPSTGYVVDPKFKLDADGNLERRETELWTFNWDDYFSD